MLMDLCAHMVFIHSAGLDYQLISSELVLTETTSRVSLLVNISDDAVVEGSELFLIYLTTRAPRVSLIPDEISVTILDNDSKGAL